MLHGDLLGERARLTPDKTALVFVPTSARLTYRELDDRAIRCARMWSDTLGLLRGDRVAVLSANSLELLDAFFAAGKTGVIFVPLNTRLTPAELGGILADAEPVAVMYDETCLETARALAARPAASVRHWIAFGAKAGPAHLAYDELSAAQHVHGFVRAACDPEDVYYLGYTSGTTGQPKGVMIPHRMLSWNGYNTAVSWQLRADDIAPIYTPLYHAGGLTAFLMPVIAIGGTVVLHRHFDATEVWRTLIDERCTVVLGVPTTWKLLMEAPEFETAPLEHVRFFISGGAPLPIPLLEAYQRRGVVFKQGYGLTEVGVNCFFMTEKESMTHPGTIGKPLMFTETRIAGADGSDLPSGEVGELWLRGPHVSRGYWRNPEATAAAIDRDGWFHTGDLATRDAAGIHAIVGRQKDMIISGGVNIYPAEIEARLLRHPAVRDAAVVGIPDERWGEATVAFVVVAEGVTSPELEAWLAGALAKFKLPRDWVMVTELPRTAYGKVVKGELRDRYLAARRSEG